MNEQASTTASRGAKRFPFPCLITKPSKWLAATTSGRLNVVSFRYCIEKARAVTLELHRPHSAHILKSPERPRPPDSELGEGTIREYNIRRYVFLAGDAGAHRLERGKQPFLAGTDRHLGIDFPHSHGVTPPPPIARPRTGPLFVGLGGDSDAEAVVASLALTSGGWIAEVA